MRGLEGVPGLPGAPQDEAGLTRKFETQSQGRVEWASPPGTGTLESAGHWNALFRSGRQRMRWLDGITDSMDVPLRFFLIEMQEPQSRAAGNPATRSLGKSE